MTGVRGAVLYGVARDLAELRALEGLPVVTVGDGPNAATQTGMDWHVPVRVGSAAVPPGGVATAEGEAAPFFPAATVPQAPERVRKFVAPEEFKGELTLSCTHRLRDVYPLNPESRKQFEAKWTKTPP